MRDRILDYDDSTIPIVASLSKLKLMLNDLFTSNLETCLSVLNKALCLCTIITCKLDKEKARKCIAKLFNLKA